MELAQVYDALTPLRAPLQRGEYDLHRMVRETLMNAGLPAAHEVRLAPRCRIDLMCGGVGVEIKRGRVERAKVLRQLTRYAACERVAGLILVTEKSLGMPREIGGKPVRVVCLNRLWGIAL